MTCVFFYKYRYGDEIMVDEVKWACDLCGGDKKTCTECWLENTNELDFQRSKVKRKGHIRTKLKGVL